MTKLLSLLILFLAASASAQTLYRPNPAAYNQVRYGPGKYSGFIVEGASTGSALMNPIYTSGSGGGTSIFTFSSTMAPTTYVMGQSDGTTYQPSTWIPKVWIVATPVGSGIPSPTGPFTGPPGGPYVPVDGSGKPVDPATGIPLPDPDPYVADFDLTNPNGPGMGNYSWLVSVAWSGGAEQFTVTAGASETKHVHLEYMHPFDYAVNPLIEGSQAPPGSDGSTPGGSGAQTPAIPGAAGGGTGGGAGGTGGGSGGTVSPGGTAGPPGDPNPDPATPGDEQGSIDRLAEIMQAAALDAKAGNNATNAELDKLNKTATAANGKLGEISDNTEETADNTGTGGSAAGSTDMTATNGLLTDLKNLITGSGTAPDMTPGSTSGATGVVSGIGQLKTAVLGLKNAFTVGTVGGGSTLAWSVSLPHGLSQTVSLEGYSSQFSVARTILLWVGAFFFLKACIEKVRGAMA